MRGEIRKNFIPNRAVVPDNMDNVAKYVQYKNCN